MEEELEKQKKPHLFRSKEELGGLVDQRINSKGNPDIAKYAGNRSKKNADGKPLTNRALRERELMSLLRKIRPHMADAIMTAVKVMKSPEAADNSKLKAATIILQQYKDTMMEVYDKDYDEAEGEEIQQDNSPVFSLKIVGE